MVRERFRAFTVDEYQDVNLLQQTLLELWLGARDELCVVGDDYQSIYAFTGASPAHLLAMPRRFPHATVIRLEDNYRSSPQVLALANRLVPELGGAEKTLRATRADGPEPVLRPCEDEAQFAVEQIRALGIAYDEIAILCRTNARLVDFEEALHEAGIPAQGASFLGRESARFVLRRLESPADVRGSRRSAAGSRARRTSSASARPFARATSRGSSGSPRSSSTSTGPASSPSSSAATATAARRAAASTC